MIINGRAITELDEWLDSAVGELYKEQPFARDWARISKISEEIGEVIQAYIGATGENPRKGTTNDMEDVMDELADTVLTGVLAIQHFTKSENRTSDIIVERLNYRMHAMKMARSKA